METLILFKPWNHQDRTDGTVIFVWYCKTRWREKAREHEIAFPVPTWPRGARRDPIIRETPLHTPALHQVGQHNRFPCSWEISEVQSGNGNPGHAELPFWSTGKCNFIFCLLSLTKFYKHIFAITRAVLIHNLLKLQFINTEWVPWQ